MTTQKKKREKSAPRECEKAQQLGGGGRSGDARGEREQAHIHSQFEGSKEVTREGST